MSETEILTPTGERAETLRRTFLAEHPKAIDTVVTLVEGMTFKVETGGTVFRAEILDGGTRATFTMADPGDVNIDLAPPILRRLVGPPEPVVPVDPSLFDVNAERRQANRLLDRLRHLAEQLRQRVRHVATSVGDEVAWLSSLVPTDAVGADYRPVSHDLTLRRMAREGIETVALLADLRSLLAEVEAYRRAVSPQLRDALVALATARAGTESLAGVPSLVNLGEVATDRFSQHEVNLEDLGDKLDVLRRAMDEINPLVPRFEEAVQVHIAALLQTTRLAAVATATSTLARLRSMAESVRTVTEAETLAGEAAARIGVTAPTITWPDDLLGAPRLK